MRAKPGRIWYGYDTASLMQTPCSYLLFFLLFSFFFLYFNYYYLIHIITLYSAVIISVYCAARQRPGRRDENTGGKVMAMRGRVTKSTEFRQAVMCVTLLQVSMAAECCKHQSTYSAYRMLFALNGQHLCKFTPFFPRLSPRSHGTGERVTFSSNRNCRVTSR